MCGHSPPSRGSKFGAKHAFGRRHTQLAILGANGMERDDGRVANTKRAIPTVEFWKALLLDGGIESIGNGMVSNEKTFLFSNFLICTKDLCVNKAILYKNHKGNLR